MNTPNDDRDETIINFHDRLIDRALAEVIGGETPPDLSERILAAESEGNHPTATPLTTPKAAHSRRWWAMAVAAMLLVGASVLMVPAMRNNGNQARDAAKGDAKLVDRGIQRPMIFSEQEWRSAEQNRRGM